MPAKLSSVDLEPVELESRVVALISFAVKLESADSVVAKRGKDTEGRAVKHITISQTKKSAIIIEDLNLMAEACEKSV